MYQAGSWDIPRRVACKVEKPAGVMIHQYTFIVTNMTASPGLVINLYCKCGNMENFIKESKNDFDFSSTSSSSMIINVNRLQIHTLAYNLVNWMRRLVVPKVLRK